MSDNKIGREAILTLHNNKKKLEDDLTTVIARMVKQFQGETGVGIESISINLIEITIHEDGSKKYLVRDVETRVAI